MVLLNDILNDVSYMHFSSSLTLAPSRLWALSRSTAVSPGETYVERHHLTACCGSPGRKSYKASSAWYRKSHAICYLNEKQPDWFQFTLQAKLIHSTSICIRNREQGEISSHVLSQILMPSFLSGIFSCFSNHKCFHFTPLLSEINVYIHESESQGWDVGHIPVSQRKLCI